MPPRRSARAASTAAASSVGDASMEQAPPPRRAARAAKRRVVESDDEEGDEAEEEVEEEEEEDVKPKKGRGGKTAAQAPPSKGARRTAPEQKPSSSGTGRGGRAAAKPRVSDSSEASAAESKAQAEEASEEEEEDDEDDEISRMLTPVKPVSRGRGKKPAMAAQAAANVAEKQKGGRKKRVSIAEPEKPVKKGRGRQAKEEVVEEEEEAEEEDADEDEEEETADAPPSGQRHRADSSASSDSSGPATPPAPASPVTDPVIAEATEPEPTVPIAAARPPPLPPMKMEPNPTVKEGESRLVIHKIVLVNFKSYAGRQVIGPFHKSFSAIVGPNGSGKSNTIDALLFVFGFKATKMRQGKLSELIHNSAASPPGGFESCSVEVWFREIIDLPGPDAYTVVPNSTLVVARTATKGNASKYTIDGRTSNFNEVTSLLRGRGIDLDHKRFLILQGEVESIAQMKPKAANEHEEGLLEYLEDIIGTSRFKEHIVESLKHVETLNEERGEKLGRVRLVEREKAALEARKKEADSYLRDQNALVHKQNALWQYYVRQAEGNIAMATEAFEACTKELEEDRLAQDGDVKEAEALEAEHKDEEAKYVEVEKATAELVKELAKIEREAVQWGEKRKHAATKQKKLKKSVGDDEHALSEAQVAIKHNGDESVKLRAEVDKHEATLGREEAELDKVRDSLKDKTQVFADQIEVKQAELVPWAAKVTEKKAALDLATSERDLLSKKLEDGKSALQQAEASIGKIKEDVAAKTTELKALRSEKKQVEKGIADDEKELRGMDAEDRKLKTAALSARQKAEDAKASQTASSSRGNVLASLTKLRDQGRLRGFHGRLGDLGRIDDKYDIAVSTACPQLDNLVCDTVEVGQACLEHLKRTNAGRASIFCLDKLPNKDLSPIDTPENVPRLFDLVTPKDAIFAQAFYKVLQNTLVAKDLAQANRIAFGKRRWRVVTLDGKLIDSSGTMSGGGTRVARGAMSSKIAADDTTPEVVARLERERDQADKVLEIFVNSRKEVETSLAGLQARLPELEMEITKAEMAINGGAKRLDEAQRTIDDLRSRDGSDDGDDAQIEALEEQIGKLKKELDQLKKRTGSFEEAIKALQDKILEVGGVKLRTQQAKVQDLKEVIDHANDRLTKAEVAKSKAERDVTKYEKAVKKNAADLEDIEAELAELEEQLQSNVAEADAMRQGAEQAKFALEEQKERLDAISEQLADKMKVINEFKARQAELKHRADEAKRVLAGATKTLEHWSFKLDKLKLHEIEDDDDEDQSAEKLAAETELQQFTVEDFDDFDIELTKAEVAKLEEDLSRASPNLSVLKEYAKREAEFMSRAADLDATTQARDAAKQRLDDLNKQRLEEFMWGFHIISSKLKEMYQMITLGGNAELELVDSLDPFSEGIIFSVMPPKKSWKNISNLSGGEKTLSSLALVFALHAFKPTPLYFMDEIDAALDFRNVSIIGNYIKDRTKNAQFIIISLRNNMFELSRRLVGIYKTNNTTKSIAVDNNDLAKMVTAH